MQKRHVAWVLLLAPLLAHEPAAADVREERPNLIGGEVTGRGILLTLNYERFLQNEFGLGFGVMGIGSSAGGGIIVPLYVSFVPGDVHSFYGSGGVTFLAGGGGLNDWDNTSLLSLTAGYQYHSYGGFFVRPLFTLLFNTTVGDEFLLWPGLTIGGSF